MGRDHIRFLHLFAPSAQATEQSWIPSADVYSTPYGWLVKLDLAGVQPEDVELSRRDRFLIVRGCRRDGCVEEGCRHFHLEISYSSFERVIELGPELAKARLVPEHRDGMLLVRVYRESDA